MQLGSLFRLLHVALATVLISIMFIGVSGCSVDKPSPYTLQAGIVSVRYPSSLHVHQEAESASIAYATPDGRKGNYQETEAILADESHSLVVSLSTVEEVSFDEALLYASALPDASPDNVTAIAPFVPILEGTSFHYSWDPIELTTVDGRNACRYGFTLGALQTRIYLVSAGDESIAVIAIGCPQDQLEENADLIDALIGSIAIE